MPQPFVREKLDGWKALADYLGKSVRTAQRWEREYGLPVHRVADPNNSNSSSVFSFADELDAWWDERVGNDAAPGARATAVTLNTPMRLAWVLGLGVVVIVVVAMSTYLYSSPGTPHTIRPIDDYEFAVFDQEGNRLWSKVFETPFVRLAEDAFPAILEDIDNDGASEVLFLHNDPGPLPIPENGLYCYGVTGKLRWKFTPSATITIDGREYNDAFEVRRFAVGADGRGESFIAVAAVHRPYSPTQVTILDANADPIGEYWHFGYVLAMFAADMDADGVDEIVLGGVNNATSDPAAARRHGARQQAFLALIEHDIDGAIGPGPTEVPAHLKRGREIAYLTLPNPSVFDVEGFGTAVWQLRPFAGGFYADVVASDQRTPGLVYEFARPFEFVRLTLQQPHEALHEQMLSEGRVTVSIDEEIERLQRIEWRVR